MELLTAELRAQLPALYAQERIEDKIVYAKFFTPDSSWTWYIIEGSPEDDDFIFFGFCVGPDPEWGYVSLNELQSARGPLGLPIERDLYFEPAPWSPVKACHERNHGIALSGWPVLFTLNIEWFSVFPLPPTRRHSDYDSA